MPNTTRGRIDYDRARALILAAGSVVLGLTVALMFVRRVDTAEVVATLLFVPIFVAFMFGGFTGGTVAGALAGAVYVALRLPQIDQVGLDQFLGLIVSRSFAFLAFGAMGGWANRQLEASLDKLELYDQIDDLTGLFNARFLVQTLDLENLRAKRYGSSFSVVVLSLPGGPIARLRRRQRHALYRDVGRGLRDAVRGMDRVAHAFDGTRHHFGVVLPETDAAGAQILAERLGEHVRAYVSERGLTLPEPGLTTEIAGYPEGGGTSLESLRERFVAIDRAEHPDTATG